MAPRYAPVKFPPGVARPGTIYDSRGRWFFTQLVRWYEGVLQAVGGWQPLMRTAGQDVDAALSDDGGSFTDETDDANAGTDDAVILLPASPAEDDAFYVGFRFRFQALQIELTTPASDGAVTWEYWTDDSGGGWLPLPGLVDETDGFTAEAGTYGVTWDLPSIWDKTEVNESDSLYFVRARVSTAGTSTALGGAVDIGVGPVDVDEVVRGIKAWRTLSSGPRLALGTPTKLYLVGQGTLEDIGPSDLVAGDADATQSSANYGVGAYGVGPYGVGDEAQDTLTEASCWTMDNYGEDLVACAVQDGRLLYYDSSAGTAAAALTNAPSCKAVVVTPEGFIVALGAGGDPRYIRWCDQEDPTVWGADDDNVAGDHNLVTEGEILAGLRTRSETLIWTTVGLHSMQWIGGAFVYGFRELGGKCGPASRRSMAVFDGRAVWMGTHGFFAYDGYVKPINSEVADYVFNDLNRTQISKVHAEVRSTFGEVWFYYPSGASLECDRYVVYNYRHGFMYVGDLARTAGVDQGVFATPISVGPGGTVYQHEVGDSYLVDGVEQVPYAVSGPVDIADGDRLLEVTNLIPDEKTLGGVEISLLARMYPTGPETIHGPYTPESETNARVTARQVSIQIRQRTPGWRFGTLRLEGQPGSRR